MQAPKSTPFSNITRAAYKSALEPHHNFWLKNTFRAALAGLPKREEFVMRLAPSLAESMASEERESICYTEMAELVEIQNRVSALCRSLFVELDLEDTRKV